MQTQFIYRKSAFCGLLLATTALTVLSGGAFAQDSSSTASPPGIETVIVTASKRAENIQNVPASVTAVSENLINRLQATSLSDIFDYVPGLNVQSSGVDADRLIIRGLTTGPNDISPSVGIYVNDAPFGSNIGYALGALFSPDIDPFDLDHIEILRGPQGTLYGASTLGGLVKFVTKTPDLDDFSGHIRADFDSQDNGPDTYSVRVGMNIPLVQDKVALRISGFYQDSDGYLTNERTGQDDLNATKKEGARADLLIKASENFSVDLAAFIDRSDTPDIGVVDGNALTLQPIYGPKAGFDYVHAFANSDATVLEGTVKYKFMDGIVASSTTSYSHFSVNEVADDTTTFQTAFSTFLGPYAADFEFAGPVHPTTNKVTEEFRLTSPSSDHFEWLAGFFYDSERSDYLSAVDSTYLYGATPPPFLAPTVAALANYETVDDGDNYTEIAGFANATYYITPQFDVSAGVRFSHNDQHLSETGSGYLALIGVIPTVSSGESSDNVWTESFDASWHFDSDSMVYARAARGYRPGGPNPTGTPFLPDTTWNYETGVKTTQLDGALTADLALFYIDWDNIQLNFFNGTNTIIGNAGDAVSKGVEFEGTYSPMTGLTFAANFDYTDAAITQLIPGAQGGAAVGNQLPFNSKLTGALRGDYYFPLSPEFVGNVGASLRYRSDFATTFPADPGTRYYVLPAETFFDLRTGVEFREHYALNFQILNVFNQQKLSGASEYLGNVTAAYADAYGQPVDLSYTPGRTFGLSLTATF